VVEPGEPLHNCLWFLVLIFSETGNILLNPEVGEVCVEVLRDAGLGDGEEFAFAGENTVGEGVVGAVVVWGGDGMKLCDFFREAAAVVNKFPASGETLDAAKRLEIHDISLQHFVGWFGIERQSQCVCVSQNACAGKSFEEIDLHLRRPGGCDECVEALRKGGFVFAGQTENEVGMDGCAGLVREAAQVLKRLRGVGTPADGGGNGRVERLYAHLQVQGLFGKRRNAVEDVGMQMVGVDFKMQTCVGRDSWQEEIKDGTSVCDRGVETAVEEFESANSALPRRSSAGRSVSSGNSRSFILAEVQ